MIVKADFHIHSCLSPCGSLEMSPSVIVETAVKKGMDCIALTDHNTALNCPAFENLCEKNQLHYFLGMEVTSAEEVHLLTLFQDLKTVMNFGEWIYSHIFDVLNNPDKMGDQVIVDEKENITGEVEKYLHAGSDLTIDEIMEQTHEYGGLFIPAHVDRAYFSMISQLGFIPEGNYDAVELSKSYAFQQDGSVKGLEPYALITDSDAHYPDSIGAVYNEMDLDDFSIRSLKRCFEHRNHRMRIDI